MTQRAPQELSEERTARKRHEMAQATTSGRVVELEEALSAARDATAALERRLLTATRSGLVSWLVGAESDARRAADVAAEESLQHGLDLDAHVSLALESATLEQLQEAEARQENMLRITRAQARQRWRTQMPVHPTAQRLPLL